jgi:hypothetical protein
MTEDRLHSMDLNDYARLAGMAEYPPMDGGTPTIITPALAEALDVLINVADEVASGESSRSSLKVALGQLRELHDYPTVRLGGGRR